MYFFEKNNKCPLEYTMNLIGTKWKPLVLFHLLEGDLCSGVLKKKHLAFQIKCLLRQ